MEEQVIFTEEQRRMHRLILEASFLTDLGLFHGKMGVVIFFYEYGKQSGNPVFTEFAGELLDEVWEEINQNTPTDFASGLAGIGWGIEYLIEKGFVDATGDICEEIDRKIMETDIRRITDLSLETGLTGLLHYVLAHIKGAIQQNIPTPFDQTFLVDLYTTAKKANDQTKDAALKELSEKYIQYYKTKESPNYTLEITQFQRSPLLWRGTWGEVKKEKEKDKEIVIFNEKSIAANYGIGTYLQEYLYFLEQTDFTTSLINLNSDYQEYTVCYGTKRQIYFFPSKDNTLYVKYYQSIIRLLRLYFNQAKRYIFHLHYDYAEFFTNELKLHFPYSKIITTVHFSYWSVILKGDNKEYYRVMQNPTPIDKLKHADIIKNNLYLKKIYDKVDNLIVLCEDAFEIFNDIYMIPHEKISLIPNGMIDTKKELSAQRKRQIRKKYNIVEDEKIILFVGRLQECKGITFLLKAFHLIIKEYPSCHLVAIGSEGNFISLLELCKNIWAKVTFTGKLTHQELIAWYQIADIGTTPSFQEESSYTGIEMQMYGLPIVASDSYSVRNMFKDDENALIAKVGDRNREEEFVQNLANRILELLTDDEKRKQIALGARKTYEEKYTIERMRGAYLQLLNSL